MKAVTIEVPDEVYEACREMAQKTGRTVEQCVMEFMLKYGPRPQPPSSEAKQRKRRRHSHFLTTQSLGYATGADNESIDADLAKEYSRGLSEGK